MAADRRGEGRPAERQPHHVARLLVARGRGGHAEYWAAALGPTREPRCGFERLSQPWEAERRNRRASVLQILSSALMLALPNRCGRSRKPDPRSRLLESVAARLALHLDNLYGGRGRAQLRDSEEAMMSTASTGTRLIGMDVNAPGDDVWAVSGVSRKTARQLGSRRCGFGADAIGTTR
jgi:hypothetical protein